MYVVCVYIYNYIFNSFHSTLYIVAQELMNGHHDSAPVPGGFGATAGPNDGWHQVLHSLSKAYLRCEVGWGNEWALRKRLDEIEMSAQGAVQTKLLVFN
jgi:hypothetical protein